VKENAYGSKAVTACIRHLDDTNFWHYSLQLNTYKAIIEAKYGRQVVELCLVCLHPNNADYQLIPVPFMEKEIADLFEYRKQMLAVAKKAHGIKTSSQSSKSSFTKTSSKPSPNLLIDLNNL
jgi:hypothetical protein